MAMALDASSPSGVSQTTNTVQNVVSGSFTPPANSLLVVMWAGNTNTINEAAATPGITDSLGAHLTYTLIRHASPGTLSIGTIGGQTALWWAKVVTSAAMTVTVTSNSASGGRDSALRVAVLTGAELTSPVETSNIVAQAANSTTFSQSYTPTISAGGGFLSMCDFTDVNSVAPTAGSGTTMFYQVVTSGITAAMVYRTAFDDVISVANTVSGAITTAEPMLWAWADIAPAASAAGPVAEQRIISQAIQRAAVR